MKRRVFHILSALSLLLCVVTCVLCVRGRWKRDHVQFTYHKARWELVSYHGKFAVDDEPEIAWERADLNAKLSAADSDVGHRYDQTMAAANEAAKIRRRIDDIEEMNRAAMIYMRKDLSPTPDEATPRELAEQWRMYAMATARWQEFRTQEDAAYAKWRTLRTKIVPTSAISHSIPALVMAVPLLILPAFSLRGFRKRRRLKREGRCLQCGYDLRASPDRCPECGAESKNPTTGAVR